MEKIKLPIFFFATVYQTENKTHREKDNTNTEDKDMNTPYTHTFADFNSFFEGRPECNLLTKLDFMISTPSQLIDTIYQDTCIWYHSKDPKRA